MNDITFKAGRRNPNSKQREVIAIFNETLASAGIIDSIINNIDEFLATQENNERKEDDNGVR